MERKKPLIHSLRFSILTCKRTKNPESNKQLLLKYILLVLVRKEQLKSWLLQVVMKVCYSQTVLYPLGYCSRRILFSKLKELETIVMTQKTNTEAHVNCMSDFTLIPNASATVKFLIFWLNCPGTHEGCIFKV